MPHCVTPLGWRDWDAATWEKVWTYRQRFDAPEDASRMWTFVDFTGAMTTARATFNGHALPEHLGGYLPFSYELTDHLTGLRRPLYRYRRQPRALRRWGQPQRHSW